MNEFVITFRESLEAALIVGIIFTVVYKQGLAAQIRMLLVSVVLAVVSSAILGVALYHILEHVANKELKELLEAVFMYITAALLFYVIFWMSKNLASQKALTDHTTAFLSEGKKWGLFFLVFFAILREGFETALFLVASTSINESFSLTGFFSGIILATLVGYLIVVQGKKIKLRPYFKYTSLLLVFFSAGMISYGTHEFHEYLEGKEAAEKQKTDMPATLSASTGTATHFMSEECEEATEHLNGDDDEEYAFSIFPSKEGSEKITSPLYQYKSECDIYINIFNSDGMVGSFFKGLFGYNSSPTWTELILWLVSLCFGLFVWNRSYNKKPPVQKAQ